jgi:hypothetical protein
MPGMRCRKVPQKKDEKEECGGRSRHSSGGGGLAEARVCCDAAVASGAAWQPTGPGPSTPQQVHAPALDLIFKKDCGSADGRRGVGRAG